MIHFFLILLVILEYLGMIIVEPEKISTPIAVIILLVHVVVFVWYTNKYPNKDQDSFTWFLIYIGEF